MADEDSTGRPDGDEKEHDGDDAAAASEPSPLGPRRVGGLVRMGCIVLMALGVIYILFVSQSLLDPSSARCAFAEQLIEDANDDDEEFNDVNLEGRAADELECEEAVRLAEQIPEDEDGEESVTVPTEGTIRVQATIIALIGVGQAFTGLTTLRTARRQARNASLVFAALGILLARSPVMIAGLVFVVYAIIFSPQSRELWGGLGGGLFRRPRPPA